MRQPAAPPRGRSRQRRGVATPGGRHGSPPPPQGAGAASPPGPGPLLRPQPGLRGSGVMLAWTAVPSPSPLTTLMTSSAPLAEDQAPELKTVPALSPPRVGPSAWGRQGSLRSWELGLTGAGAPILQMGRPRLRQGQSARMARVLEPGTVPCSESHAITHAVLGGALRPGTQRRKGSGGSPCPGGEGL